MDINLVKAGMEDCDEIHKLQIVAFDELLKKYNDISTNPGAEKIEKIIQRMEQPFTDYYFIRTARTNIGVIRVRRGKDDCTISPIFVIPEYQNKGYAEKAILQLECLYPNITKWQLSTIKEEKKLCHFYEKLGYRCTGNETQIQEGMTIIDYMKLM